nr:odorant receptor 4-like [Nomia melanderi]
MTMVEMTLTTTQVAISYITFETLLLIINSYLSTQFRISGYRLCCIWKENDGNINSVDYTNKCHARMKKWIRQHQTLIEFTNGIERIFRIHIFLYVLLVSMLMCLGAYQIFFIESVATRKIIFIVFTIGSVGQVILFSYSCGSLITDSEEITLSAYATSLFSAPMDKSGRLLRKDLQIIMLRTQKPCYLTACGFFPISLETSTKLLSTAVSYFTLLRESASADEKGI